MLKGTARRLAQSDNINTDYIISGRYKFKVQDPKELAKHIFEDIDPSFAGRLQKGDFIVAGKNFGMGSSREQAALALKEAGISGVLAESFARIFYRNAINIGLPLVECDTKEISDGDELAINLLDGSVGDVTKHKKIIARPLPEIMRAILEAGGIINYLKIHKGITNDQIPNTK